MRNRLLIAVLCAVFGFSVALAPPFMSPVSVHAQSAFCDQTVAISVASGNSQTIITGLSGAFVRVCAFVISADTIATTATFASSGTNLTGAMRLCDECNISVGGGTGVLFEGTIGGNLTITAATGAVTGFVRFGRN